MPDVYNSRGEFKPEPERNVTLGDPKAPGPHRMVRVGFWGDRLQCRDDGTILMADHELGAWVGGNVFRGDWTAESVMADPHFVPFEPAESDPDSRVVDDIAEAIEEGKVTVSPDRWRMCKGTGEDGDPCTYWEHECPDHDSPARASYRRDWAAAHGITTPREEQPSRQDRSAEYAKRNAARRRERARV